MPVARGTPVSESPLPTRLIELTIAAKLVERGSPALFSFSHLL